MFLKFSISTKILIKSNELSEYSFLKVLVIFIVFQEKVLKFFFALKFDLPQFGFLFSSVQFLC